MPVRLTEMQSNTIGLIIYRYYATACRRRRCFKATAVLQTANDSVHGPTAAQTCVKENTYLPAGAATVVV